MICAAASASIDAPFNTKHRVGSQHDAEVSWTLGTTTLRRRDVLHRPARPTHYTDQTHRCYPNAIGSTDGETELSVTLSERMCQAFAAGTFCYHGELVFWDIRHPEQTIIAVWRMNGPEADRGSVRSPSSRTGPRWSSGRLDRRNNCERVVGAFRSNRTATTEIDPWGFAVENESDKTHAAWLVLTCPETLRSLSNGQRRAHEPNCARR